MGLFVAYFSVIFFKNEREAYAITSLAVCLPLITFAPIDKFS
jgi:hypothetical protein